jgi:hypothetical protein
VNHAQPDVRAAACRALGWIGPAAAAAGPALTAIRDDIREDGHVRSEAREALRRIGDRSGAKRPGSG